MILNTEEYPISIGNEIKYTKEVYDCLQLLRLRTILKEYEVNLILDVGANEGQFASVLRDIGYVGTIISFEPLSKEYRLLSQAASKDSNWYTYNLALGKQNKEQILHVSDKSTFSSFLLSNSLCEQRFGKESIGDKNEVVSVRRLDNFLVEVVKNIDKMRIYLKMDTQGYDLEVFSGAGTLLKNIVALQSEVSVVPIYHSMPDMLYSISLFQEAGFSLSGMYPVTYVKPTLQVIEFDCLMVKADTKIS
ncbi:MULTISPECIES: FkbM family methyltransferase [Cyanophyceae]|uniref:FkbM family methyltransferase n=1 Tax=Cyanophyceae TaxID=3028117 RepID=UPI00016DC790|nr:MULTISPECIES: FkbM family methyltransferase [Cyanophyceae]ACA99141.1 methyltransferase, FkbM family protein [Picosynechococcus sp. PCC 7002]SMH34432.1 methyltransferase, FkbM family [Picosynechococcus sp. OG1]SMQ84605.1 methyltransferase, FkbM family [Synechococcus sp. 7002]